MTETYTEVQEREPLEVIPQGIEERKVFFDKFNSAVAASEEIEVYKAHIKETVTGLAKDFMEKHPHTTYKEGEVKRAIGLLLDEHMKGKVSKDIQMFEDVKDSYDIAKKYIS